jgi:hypothetical protein
MPVSISSALATPSASTKDGSLIIDTRILVVRRASFSNRRLRNWLNC